MAIHSQKHSAAPREAALRAGCPLAPQHLPGGMGTAGHQHCSCLGCWEHFTHSTELLLKLNSGEFAATGESR